MVIAVDFDGCIAEPSEPLRRRPGAREALWALRRAGHDLVLFSGRLTPPNTAVPPGTSPRAYAAVYDSAGWRRAWLREAWARTEMLNFLRRESLLDLFGEVWDKPGKPWHADLFIDDRAFRLVNARDWGRIAEDYGAQAPRGVARAV